MASSSADLLEEIAASPRLPSVPIVALELIELVQRSDVSVEQLATTIGNDPALSSKILMTANSSFYTRERSATTITEAVVILGLNMVRTLALGFTLAESAGNSSGLDRDHFWRRSVRTAIGARTLAGLVAPSCREEAFLAGLLCRFGILGLGSVRGSEYGALVAQCDDDYLRLEQLEADELGFTHLDLGCRLATDWHLPASVTATIANLRSPSDSGAEFEQLVRLVATADALAGVFGDCPANALSLFRAYAADWFGLSEDDADQLVAETDASARSLFNLFEIGAGDALTTAEIMTRAHEALAEVSISTALKATRLEEENHALATQASTDTLTGLASRRHFDEFLIEQVAIAHRYRGDLALLFLDLDHFKEVNDSFGHQAGDQVLRVVGEVLRRGLRDSDLAGRYGGEEFAIVMPATDGDQARAGAERLRAAIEAAETIISDREGAIRVTVSIGVAELSKASLEGPEALVARADTALFAAKLAGRNRVVAAAIEAPA